ncbi:hypothetical protein [Aestuariivita boseongensis]|uniref:hypothetical protein n=1 Tax=Aestuariivita boseongensis TaxID=1470562 RepID=UPI0006818199|nr:hypothetical protein [Aestuariivita boseongensis]
MTSDRITARNRANARKSTGPKTKHGKDISAGNARRHGATARPDPESIAAWLGIILDRPDITIKDLLPSDEAGYRALALAEAEVKIVAAERALLEFEAGLAPPRLKSRKPPLIPKEDPDLDNIVNLMKEKLKTEECTKAERRKAEAALKTLARMRAPRVSYYSQNGHHRLLRRYLSEARSKRRKAFEAWAAMTTSEEAPR